MVEAETRAGIRAPKKLGLAIWATAPLPVLIEQVRLAESIGFDSIWVIDSQLICRDVFVTLTALAAGTSRIALATGVTQPTTRHPAVTASALAALQEYTGGRMLAGVGTGFSSLRTLGLPAARMAEFKGFLGTVRQLLAGEPARFDNGFEGRMTWLEKPAPVPLFGAASGPKMTRLVAGIADGAILLQGVSPELLSRGLGWLAEGAAAAGRGPDTLDVACWVPFGLADDGEAARGQVLSRVASAVMNADPDEFAGAERDAVLTLRAGYKDFEHAAALGDHAQDLPDGIVDRYSIAGRPEAVCEKLGRLMAHDGIDHVILTPQAAADEHMDLSALLRLMDREVLSRL